MNIPRHSGSLLTDDTPRIVPGPFGRRTDIGEALADGDLIIVDNGAGGTNRKSEIDRVPTYVFSKVSGDATVASNVDLPAVWGTRQPVCSYVV